MVRSLRLPGRGSVLMNTAVRVASSVRWAIRKDVYDAEAVTQVAEDRGTIEPVRTERVDGPATFDIKGASPPAERAGHLGSWALSCERTTSTGQGAWRITASEILPSMALLIPLWPRQPITIRSAWSSLAKTTISRSTTPIPR